jgi:hypothetical protein
LALFVLGPTTSVRVLKAVPVVIGVSEVKVIVAVVALLVSSQAPSLSLSLSCRRRRMMICWEMLLLTRGLRL